MAYRVNQRLSGKREMGITISVVCLAIFHGVVVCQSRSTEQDTLESLGTSESVSQEGTASAGIQRGAPLPRGGDSESRTLVAVGRRRWVLTAGTRRSGPSLCGVGGQRSLQLTMGIRVGTKETPYIGVRMPNVPAQWGLGNRWQRSVARVLAGCMFEFTLVRQIRAPSVARQAQTSCDRSTSHRGST